MRRSAAIGVLPAVSGILAAPVVLEPQPEAGVDQVFINGAIYTLNDAQPWAEAVAVDGNEIVYVGDVADALAIWPVTKRCSTISTGKMLLPGLIDTHMHPISGGAYAKAR